MKPKYNFLLYFSERAFCTLLDNLTDDAIALCDETFHLFPLFD